MADRYCNFAELAANEVEGADYRIRVTERASPVVVVAPHGGTIEPTTSELAAAIAGDEFSLYCFEGLVPGRPHGDLHITSERFDEPTALRLVEAAAIIIAVHGRKDDGDAETVWLGGGDTRLRDAIGDAIARAGFSMKTHGHRLPGRQPDNICNRGRTGAGVQLELPRTLRDRLRADRSLREALAAAVREAIIQRIAEMGRH